MIKTQALILGWINDERLPKADLFSGIPGRKSREALVEVCHRGSQTLTMTNDVH